jgi:predicted outer membrane repeat protein
MGGGGVRNTGTLTLQDVDISGNTATKTGEGGGIYNSRYGTVTLISSSITGNDAEQGGGIYNYYGIVNLGGGSINGNTATNDGGGIYNWDFGPFSTLFISGTSLIINNEATTGTGGGIYSGNSLVTFDGTQVVVKSNKARLPSSESSWYQGWGVYLNSGTPTTTGGFDPTTQVTDNVKI